MAENCFFEDGCIDGCRALDMKLLLRSAVEVEDIQEINRLGRSLAVVAQECPNMPEPTQNQDSTQVLAC